MSEITNHPLTWPDNVARTAPHLRGSPNFMDRTVADAVRLVLAEINRLNARRWDHFDESVIVSTNLRPRLDGLPLAGQAEPADSGVAIYFSLRFQRNGKWHERPCVLTCDKWRKIADNIHAIAKDIEAQRARQRWGCTNIEQAFRGYTAIPERCGGKSWWELLGVDPRATQPEIETAFKRLAVTAHPDKGGSHDYWVKVREAYNQAMAQFTEAAV